MTYLPWTILGIVIMIAVVQIGKERSAAGLVLSAVSLIYCAGLVYFTMILGARDDVARINWKLSLPLMRALRSGHYGLTANRSLLNILLFVPFGYLLPLLLARFRNKAAACWQILAAGLLASLVIESSQLIFRRGVFELDDLVKNTIGTGAGYLIFLILNRSVQKPLKGQRFPSLSQTSPEAETDNHVAFGQKSNQADVGIMNDINVDLLMNLLRAGITGERPCLDLFADRWADVSTRRVAELAARHDVVLTIYGALDGAENPVLLKLKKALSGLYAPQFAKIINQDREGSALLDAFDEAGIDCIPLKGWVLRQLYADPFSRSMSDLDILVRDYKYERIRLIMEAQGYTPHGSSSWKHDKFTKDPFMNVEVHKRLTDNSGSVRAWEDQVWEHCTRVEGTKHRFAMSDEDFYVFHLVHMHKDFMNGALGFRRLADLWLLRRNSSEEAIASAEGTLADLGLGLFSERMARVASVCFDGCDMDQNSEVLLRFAADGAVFTDNRRYKLGRMATLSDGSVNQAKVKSVFCAIFLPPQRMKAQFPILNSRPALMPYYWLKRIFQMMRRAGRRLKQMDYRGITREQLEEMREVFRAGGV